MPSPATRTAAETSTPASLPALVPVLLILFNAVLLAALWESIRPAGIGWLQALLFIVLASSLTLLELAALVLLRQELRCDDVA